MVDKILRKDLKITVIGLGYIGFPTAVLFASKGFKVFGYDKNREIIEKLSLGELHVVEPKLEQLFKDALNKGFFRPVNEIVKSDVYIICVPTPFKTIGNEKKSDLKYVYEATLEVSKVIEKNNLVVLESTVPPGTTADIASIIENKTGLKAGKDFYISHSPERVLPGKIVEELKRNSRIIGADDEYSASLTKNLYFQIVESEIYITDTKTAELCKLAENAFRDLNIAFANELSIISNNLGIDHRELIRLANKHPRVNILNPGVGVGGHCLAVDPWFIVEKDPENAILIRTAREVNEYKTKWLSDKIDEIIKSRIQNRKVVVGILGLTYKPNVNDVRESPSIKLANYLIDKGYEVLAHDPLVKDNLVKNVKNIDLEELMKKSDAIVITVAHNVFSDIESIFQKRNGDKIYIDLTNLTVSKGIIRL